MTALQVANVFAGIGQLIWICSYLPQLYKTYKTKRSSDLSLVMWFLVLAGYLTILPVFIITKLWILVVGYSVCLLLVIAQLVMTIMYSKKRRKK